MPNWYEILIITPVRALNEIRSNVWSIGVIVVGALLVIHGQSAIGGSLITGAFAILRSSDPATAPVPPTSAPQSRPNEQK